MTPAQQREETLFAAALAKAPADRDAFLEGACHGDPALRARLVALLAEHEKPDELPTAANIGPGGTLKIGRTTLVTSITEQAGDRIGPYKLREKIGEGGCGVVYVAEQEKPVRRRVALKVIKLGMDTRNVIARFEAERQALAMMDHPNIAKVLDAGATGAAGSAGSAGSQISNLKSEIPSGRPYFVMELVRGIRITDYCDQHNLSTQDRLGLFMKVCHAIQHAHQKGIIHRDIKPSNILVALHDGVPVPKVIDFGIAKATEGRLSDLTVYTEMHQFIGTPAYMSPEQAEMSGLDIDTRSDIYALGVLLYELLTGQTPFDATELWQSGIDAIRRTIREVEPPKPSTRLSTMLNADLTLVAKRHGAEPGKFSKRVRGDLDWIVMTCLEKDRTRRYETANGLATDIQRHLNNEPIHARPPSTAYRLRKLIRRNKLAFAAGTAIAASLVIGIAGSVWQTMRATHAERKTAAERDAKELARQDAEAISKFLTQVFQSPDPARDGRTITVAETLDKAASKLETDLATQPARRARLQGTLGDTYSALGLTRQSIPLYEKSRDYLLATLGTGNARTLEAMHKLAASYSDAGRLNEAIELQKQVLTHCRKLEGPEHPNTLKTMNGLGVFYSDAGRRDEALKLREEVLALSRKVLGPKHPDTLSALHNLASSYAAADRADEALRLREEVLAVRRTVNGYEHPDTLKAMLNLAGSYSHADRKEQAFKLLEETLSLSRKVNGPEHPDTLKAMSSLKQCYEDVNRQDQALKLSEELLSLAPKVFGSEHPETLNILHNLGNSYSRAGRQDEALRLRENVLALRRKVNGPEHPDTLKAIKALGDSYTDFGRNEEALQLRELHLTLTRKVSGPEHLDILDSLNDMASSYYKAGRRDEALNMREEVLAGLRKMRRPEDSMTLNAMHNLSLSYHAAGRHQDLIKLLEEAVPLMGKVLGLEHANTLEAMTKLALSYAADGRHNEALKLQEEVLTLRRKVNGPENRETLGAMTNLAQSYARTGRLPEAVTLQEQTLAIKRRVLQPGDPYLAAALGHMAYLCEKTGRTEEAAALRKERSVARLRLPASVAAALVPPNSEWKWLHPTNGVDPAVSHPKFHTTFFTAAYDDSAWKSGNDSGDPNGGFGYGRGFNGVDIGLPPDENHRHSAYFRHSFTTDKPHAGLELRCQRDDAIIVYLDGTEVLRDNLPDGPEAYLMSATIAQRPDNDGVIHRFPIPGTLAPGRHVLAISLHNTELPSSDLRIGGITLVEISAEPKPPR